MKKDINLPISSLGLNTNMHKTWKTIYRILSINKEMPDNWSEIEPTIGDVLSMDIKKEFEYAKKHGCRPVEIGSESFATAFLKEHRKTCSLFHQIRRKLIKMGYTQNDGPFLYYGTKSYYIDKIIKETGLTHKEANKFLEIAISMKWTLPYLSEQ